MRQTEGFFALFQSEARRGYGDWHLRARLRIPNRGPGILICSVGQRRRSKRGADRQRDGFGEGWVEGETEPGRDGKVRRGGGWLLLSFLLI